MSYSSHNKIIMKINGEMHSTWADIGFKFITSPLLLLIVFVWKYHVIGPNCESVLCQIKFLKSSSVLGYANME